MHQEPFPEIENPSTEDKTGRSQSDSPPARASLEAAIIELKATLHYQAQAGRGRVSKSVAEDVPDDQEVGLFLVRPTAASAVRALGTSRVEMNSASKSAQISRLREFRNDTRALAHDAGKWLLERGGGRLVRETEGLISGGFVAALSQAEAAALRQDVSDVQVLENRLLHIVPPVRRAVSRERAANFQHWHLEAIGQSKARREGRAYSGRGVHVAILDTGVEMQHPELGGRVSDGWRLRGPGAPVNASAVIADSSHADTDGHGTHVAGLILGTNVGVAPDATASSVTMMPKGYATTFDFIRCLDWAANDLRIRLVNFSAGISPYDGDMIPFIADLIRLGVSPFIAVGNGGRDSHDSPGDYALGVSVGSIDPPTDRHPSEFRVSAFSSSANMSVDHMTYSVPNVVAPGDSIYSCINNGQYAEDSGTSMATPIACGVAACLIEEAGGSLSVSELEEELFARCLSVAGPLLRQGKGLVQVS